MSRVLVWLLLIAAAPLAQAAPDVKQIEHLTRQGDALFHGQAPLVARIRHHEHALPAIASRCSNCHGAGAGADIPRLTGAMLTRAQPRLGGPAIGYDEASFCRLLRTSITPNHIVLPQAMPQYQLSDGQCAALWTYLQRVPEGSGNGR